MIITLSPAEAIYPIYVGARRQLWALSNRSKPDGKEDDEHWFDNHIFGAMAEFVVARSLNLFWHPQIGPSKGPDVGGIVGVCCRRPREDGSGGDLAIRHGDTDNMPKVLVHNRGTLDFELVGWLAVKEGRHSGIFNVRCNCWYVEPPYHPIDDLVAAFRQGVWNRKFTSIRIVDRGAPDAELR